MRIGIDAKFLTHPQKGGFKTYTESLIGALSEVDRANEYILYVDRDPQPTDLIPHHPNFIVKVVSGSHKIHGMAWREQFSLPRQISKDGLDIFHAPCLTAPIFLDVPSVVTIHDMIWYYPSRYLPHGSHFSKRKLMEWYYQFVPFIAARRAKAVITVSNAAKQSILLYLKLSHDRIYVTYEAANNFFHPISEDSSKDIIHQYGLGANYILAIGSADPRKNIRSLIKAYSLLPDDLRKQYDLVIVWNHKLLASELFLEAQELDITKHIHFLENISDENLIHLYNQASLFVFPSLEEGFGIPPLEAMACGTPVLSANNSSIPEIVGDSALQFSAENVNELSDLILKVLMNPALQIEMAKRGLERSASFSWEKCAQETLRVFEQVECF